MKVVCLLILITLTGCGSVGFSPRSLGNNESYIIVPCSKDAPGAICKDGQCNQRYVVGAKSDGKVTFTESDGTAITVDNRGKENTLESLIKLYGLKVIDD